jgi:hypothetical protein
LGQGAINKIGDRERVLLAAGRKRKIPAPKARFLAFHDYVRLVRRPGFDPQLRLVL